METTIVRATFPLSKELTSLEAEVIVSQQSKRIRMCNEVEIYEALKNAIAKCYFNCGQSMNFINVDLEIKELLQDVIKYFPTICINEIEIFFKQGIDGLAGDYFGLNCKTYRQWLRAGMANTNRLLAMKKQSLYLQELNKPTELTAAEKEKIIYDGVIVCFDLFKSKGQLQDYGNITYNYLDNKKLIPFTIERKKEFFKQAEESVRAGLVTEMGRCKSSKVDSIKQILANLPKETIQTKAKEIALIDFFNYLIETNTSLKDLL